MNEFPDGEVTDAKMVLCFLKEAGAGNGDGVFELFDVYLLLEWL